MIFNLSSDHQNKITLIKRDQLSSKEVAPFVQVIGTVRQRKGVLKVKCLKPVIFLICISVLLSLSARAEESKEGTYENCTRAMPEPLFAKKMTTVKSTKFQPVTKEEGAKEEVVFASGDRLFILNWGCEYFVNTFRYESKSMSVSPENIKDVFMKTARTLRKLEGYNPNIIFDLGKAAATLDKVVKEGKDISFQTWYPVEGDGLYFLQTRVVVKGGGPLEKEEGSYVEFELFKGPL
jgi:hypothetical protein